MSGCCGRPTRTPVATRTRQLTGPPTYLDTSAIIDGRLVDVVASGFLAGTLVVPRFVLGELQHIADDADPARRSRGRRGLEVLSVLQKDHRIDLDLSDEDVPGVKAVDAKLVALALAPWAAWCSPPTTTSTGSPSSRASGSMNLNQLANAMKPAFLPGEADAGQGHPGGQGARPGRRLPR